MLTLFEGRSQTGRQAEVLMHGNQRRSLWAITFEFPQIYSMKPLTQRFAIRCNADFPRWRNSLFDSFKANFLREKSDNVHFLLGQLLCFCMLCRFMDGAFMTVDIPNRGGLISFYIAINTTLNPTATPLYPTTPISLNYAYAHIISSLVPFLAARVSGSGTFHSTGPVSIAKHWLQSHDIQNRTGSECESSR